MEIQANEPSRDSREALVVIHWFGGPSIHSNVVGMEQAQSGLDAQPHHSMFRGVEYWP